MIVAAPHTYQVPEWGNATLIELTWLFLGTVGFAVTLASLLFIARDRMVFYRSLGLIDGTGRREAARLLWRSHLRREAGRVFQMAIMLSIGVWACLQPPIVRPTVTTPTGLILTFALFVWASFATGQSIADSLVRRRITEILDESEVT